MAAPEPKRRRTRASYKASTVEVSPAELPVITEAIPPIKESSVEKHNTPVSEAPVSEEKSDEERLLEIERPISLQSILLPPAVDPVTNNILHPSILPKMTGKVFKMIGHVASACLGVTCRQFYKCYLFSRGRNSRVPLRLPMSIVPDDEWVMQPMLHNYLGKWMAKAGYVWDYHTGKFVRTERMSELKRAKEIDHSYETGRW